LLFTLEGQLKEDNKEVSRAVYSLERVRISIGIDLEVAENIGLYNILGIWKTGSLLLR